MAYVLDFAVILIFGLMVFIGYKRGVAKSLVRLVGLLLAVVLAFVLSGPLAEAVFDGVVAEPFAATLEGALEDKLAGETTESSVREGVETMLTSIPKPLVNLLENLELGTVDSIMEKVDGVPLEAGKPAAESVTLLLMEYIVRPLMVCMLRVVAFLVILVVAALLVLLLAGLVDAIVSNLPLIKQANKSIGALIGALEGLLLVLVLVSIIQVAASAGNEESLINQAVLDNTLITGPLSQINPLGHYFQSVILALKPGGAQ